MDRHDGANRPEASRPSALILGATGFIGGQITRSAIGRSWRVRAARRHPRSVGAVGDLDRIEWASLDLAEPDSLVAAMQGMDVVFHAAGRYAHTSRRIALHVAEARAEMRRVLSAASRAGVRRLVYTSTMTTIGPSMVPGRPADERSPYAPGSARDAYHELKWAMEVEALAGAPPGLEVVALCPTAVLGPGDVHLTISGPLLAVARGHVRFTVGGMVNVIDVRDAAEAHLAAAERGRAGERYILGGHNVPLPELIALAARVAEVRAPRWRLPDAALGLIGALSSWLPGDPAAFLRSRHLLEPLSNAKAVSELGLSPRPLEETLRDAIEWLRARESPAGKGLPD